MAGSGECPGAWASGLSPVSGVGPGRITQGGWTMAPETAVVCCGDIDGALMRKVSALRAEGEDIRDQWEGLTRVGGGRADHAAALLGRLRNHLQDISRYAATVDRQIADMVADPFGRREGTSAEGLPSWWCPGCGRRVQEGEAVHNG
jgi:hypothetical protein